MKRKVTGMLLVAAIAAFLIHVVASARWLVINLTTGNRKGIPLSADEAVPFFITLAVLACAAWFSRTAREEYRRTLSVVTILNVSAFCCTAALMQTGTISILK